MCLRSPKSVPKPCLFLWTPLAARHQGWYWVCPDCQPSVHAQNNDLKVWLQQLVCLSRFSPFCYSSSCSLNNPLLSIYSWISVCLALLVVVHRDTDQPPAPPYNLEIQGQFCEAWTRWYAWNIVSAQKIEVWVKVRMKYHSFLENPSVLLTALRKMSKVLD